MRLSPETCRVKPLRIKNAIFCVLLDLFHHQLLNFRSLSLSINYYALTQNEHNCSASSQQLTCLTKRSTDCNLSYLSFTGAQLSSAVSTDMNNEELSVFICQSYYSMEHKMVQGILSILYTITDIKSVIVLDAESYKSSAHPYTRL